MSYDKTVVIDRINNLKKENREKVRKGEPVQDLSNNQKLAQIFNVEEKTIQNWLNKKPGKGTEISLENLVKFSDLFQVDINYLLGNIEEKNQVITDVVKVTGLDPIAIDNLTRLKRFSDSSNKYIKELSKAKLEVINKLLCSGSSPLQEISEMLQEEKECFEISNQKYFDEYMKILKDWENDYYQGNTDFNNKPQYIKDKLLSSGVPYEEINKSIFDFEAYADYQRNKDFYIWKLEKAITEFLYNLV